MKQQKNFIWNEETLKTVGAAIRKELIWKVSVFQT